ncbi:MAG: 50S ribosomal protein L35 [Vampirovibrionales bacterium]
MPKMKTHKSGAKRYKLTASGKLLRNQAGRGHLNEKKTSIRKQRLDHVVQVSESFVKKVLRQELPYAKYAR